MSDRKVTKIPATITHHSGPIKEKKNKLRVAAYARVSTDHNDQFTSYEAQIDYYTQYIKSRSDWEFVKVYTDEGITGTSTKHREGFKHMVSDALNGKIDLILTKSVSRFARNTVDSLTTIRKLKEHNVECYFEKENIWTFDGKGELLITIMSSLAQEESRSISENCTWGQRKRFSDGKATVPFGRFLGYDRGPNGEFVVNPEQAKVVKQIYRLFLNGLSYHGIARRLTDEGIKTPGGKNTWNTTTIKSILQNEKYKGDALLQKGYTTDFLTKKRKKNEGELPQYYVKGSHEAIVTPEMFNLVQHEIEKRSNDDKYHNGLHVFSCKVKCGQCGSWYGPKVWHSNSKYRKVVWRCNHKYDSTHCKTPHLSEEQLQEAFLSAANKLLTAKDSIISNGREMSCILFDTTKLEKERDTLAEDAHRISDMIEESIHQNATLAQDQDEYQKKYNLLISQYDTCTEKINSINKKIKTLQFQRDSIDDFLKAFNKTTDTLTDFSPDTFVALCDHIVVYNKDDIRIIFRNGQEIKA